MRPFKRKARRLVHGEGEERRTESVDRMTGLASTAVRLPRELSVMCILVARRAPIKGGDVEVFCADTLSGALFGLCVAFFARHAPVLAEKGESRYRVVEICR